LRALPHDPKADPEKPSTIDVDVITKPSSDPKIEAIVP
jgi:hypothetical protein